MATSRIVLSVLAALLCCPTVLPAKWPQPISRPTIVRGISVAS